LIIAHQLTEPSAIAKASSTSSCVSGSSSGPPQARGIAMPNTPASFKDAAMCSGRCRVCSISSAAAVISPCNSRAARRIGETSWKSMFLRMVIATSNSIAAANFTVGGYERISERDENVTVVTSG
jgi:hypothetical protein